RRNSLGSLFWSKGGNMKGSSGSWSAQAVEAVRLTGTAAQLAKAPPTKWRRVTPDPDTAFSSTLSPTLHAQMAGLRHVKPYTFGANRPKGAGRNRRHNGPSPGSPARSR